MILADAHSAARFRPATDGFGHRRTDEVSVDLVVKRGFRFVPRPQHAWSEPTHFLYEARPRGPGGFRSFMRSRQQAQQFRKGNHPNALVFRHQPGEVILREERKVARVGDVENSFAPGRFSGMPESGGFAGTREAAQSAHRLARVGEFCLLRRPRRRDQRLVADVLSRERHVGLLEAMGFERGMVVVMADGAEEDCAFGRKVEASVTEGLRAARGPPRVKMAARTAAEARPAPAFVDALGGFEKLAAFVEQQTLQQQGGALAHARRAVGFQLFEKLFVAEEGAALLSGLRHRLPVSYRGARLLSPGQFVYSRV